MPWIKRNLGLVIGGVVALALMGLAGFYLWSQIEEERAVTEQLDQATLRFNELLNRPVHPGNDKINNVERAKEEQARLKAFAAQLRKEIVSPDLPKDLSHREFRALLDNTITELQREADRLGISLPTGPGGSKEYWFTFQSQKTAVEFKNLENLAHALMDVKAICEILYQAKVHDIVALKRVPASSDESGTDFLTDKKASTNDYAIVTPYEVTFQGFSSELARVLEGFIRSKRCFVVKTVAADKAPSGSSSIPNMPQQMMNPYGGRYGRGMMPGMRAPAPVAPNPYQAQRGPAVLLDENKLRFTIVVDSVRLKPEPQTRGQAQFAAQPQF